MPLPPRNNKMARQAAAPAILDDIAKCCRVGRLADNAHVWLMTMRRRPFHHLHRAVDSITLFIAGDQKADRPAGCIGRQPRHCGDKSGNAAFHVGRTAAIEPPILDHRAKRVMRPGITVTDGDHIGMAGKADMRAVTATAGEQIVDPRITLTKGQALADKAKRRQLILKTVERTAIMRRHRRAADQPLCQRDSMRRRQRHQSRSNSLTEVFERVFSSTFLMMTAQASDGPGAPSASGLPGSVPGTTTE